MKFLSKIFNVISWILFIGLGLMGMCVVGGLIIGLVKAWYEKG